MAVDEQRRNALYRATAEVFGEDHAATMFEMLPPPSSELATEGSVASLGASVDQRFAEAEDRLMRIDRRLDQVDRRLEQVERRLEQVDRHLDQIDRRLGLIDRHLEQIDNRFEQVDARFEQVDQQFDTLRHELVSTFRGELVTAVSGQARLLLVAVMSTVAGVGGLAIAFSQLL
jgi:archaellum component FlaC